LRIVAGDKLRRTPGAASNRRTWTYSCWAKRGVIDNSITAFCPLFGALVGADGGGGNAFRLGFQNGTGRLSISGSGTLGSIIKESTATFTNCGVWLHVVCVLDTTNATTLDRTRLYVNGTPLTLTTIVSPPLNDEQLVNTTIPHGVGDHDVYVLEGYIAEVNFVDGLALDPTYFAQTVGSDWVPKAYAGAYGTNGFYLKFADNSAATAAALGKDTSGNGHNFTPTALSVAAGAGNDCMTDHPTEVGVDDGIGGTISSNFCVFNPSTAQTRDGNLKLNGTASVNGTLAALPASATSNAYWEITASGGSVSAGVILPPSTISSTTIADGKTYGFRLTTAGALDYKNITDSGAWTAITTGLTATRYPYASCNSPAFAILNTGQRTFAAPAPAGYKCICSTNV
jgi:hypothetical protein